MSWLVVEDKREALVLEFIADLKAIKKTVEPDFKSEIKDDEVIHWGNNVIPDEVGAQRIFLKDTDVDFIPDKDNHEQELILEIHLAIRRATKEESWRDLVRLYKDVFLRIGKNQFKYANAPWEVFFTAENIFDFQVTDEEKAKGASATIIIRANYINAKWNCILQ